jgi:hypothetical protein
MGAGHLFGFPVGSRGMGPPAQTSRATQRGDSSAELARGRQLTEKARAAVSFPHGRLNEIRREKFTLTNAYDLENAARVSCR